jgi:hypothetical protein
MIKLEIVVGEEEMIERSIVIVIERDGREEGMLNKELRIRER